MVNYVILPNTRNITPSIQIEQAIAAHGNMKIVHCMDDMAVVDTDADTAKAFKDAHKRWAIDVETTLPMPEPVSPFPR